MVFTFEKKNYRNEKYNLHIGKLNLIIWRGIHQYGQKIAF